MWRTRTSLDLSARVTVQKKTPPSMYARDGIATWRHESIIYSLRIACKTRGQSRGHGVRGHAFAHPTGEVHRGRLFTWLRSATTANL
jgi:hypothetical protein